MRQLSLGEVSSVGGGYEMFLAAVAFGAASSGLVGSFVDSDTLQSAPLGGAASAGYDLYASFSSPGQWRVTRLAQAAFVGAATGWVYAAVTVERADRYTAVAPAEVEQTNVVS